MNVLVNQIKMELKLFFRRRDELFWTLAFPVFFIVLFGLIYGDTQWDEIRAIEYLVPGIVVMGMMTTGIMNSATTFVEERGRGIYRRLAVTPLKRSTVIGSLIINKYVIVLLQTVVLLLIGFLVWKITIAGNWFFIWLIVTLGALCFLSIGFALTGVIRSTKSATPVTMIVFFLLLFLGGIFFPAEIMPQGISYISNVLPSTYLNDALRIIAIESGAIGDIGWNLLAIGAWTVGCLLLSIRFFKWE